MYISLFQFEIYSRAFTQKDKTRIRIKIEKLNASNVRVGEQKCDVMCDVMEFYELLQFEKSLVWRKKNTYLHELDQNKICQKKS